MARPIAPVVAMLVVGIAGCTGTADDAAPTTGVPTTSTPPPDVTLPATSTSATVPPASDVRPDGAVPTVATADGVLFDEARQRSIPYRVYAPIDVAGPLPVILVSHGGTGSNVGHLSGGHIGTTLAERGFAALHIGHRASTAGSRQTEDRPDDVTFVLDRIADGSVALPDGAIGTFDVTRVGHTGHSYGAYTAHAVAGADYGQTFTDERVDAIAALSPQGPDQFGAFDRGPGDNTWMTVSIPVYDIIGEAEIDSNAVDSIVRPGWRLVPFERYPGTADTIQTVIAGQDHSDLWRTGSAEVSSFTADAVADFFGVYVAGDTTVDPCTIGAADPGFAVTERRPATEGSLIVSC